VIAAIEGDEYRCGDNISISKVAALTLEGARQVRQNRIEKRIADLGAEIKKLKGALRSQPTILKAEGQAAAPIKTTRAKAPTKKHSAPLDTITIRKLKSQYGAHAVDVLDDWLEELPRKEKTLTTYRIAKPLPTAEEFKELQTAKFTTSVEHLVSSAFSEFEDLANELSDWYDSLPDNFQSGDKGCAIDEAQCTLSNLSMPDLKDNIGCLRVVHLPLTEITSRASRRDDAVERLASVVAVLRDVSDATISNDCQILIEELENAISEAEEVEFPGMY